MFSPDDTIVAIATPDGRGSIGVIRLSGPQAPVMAAAILDRSSPLQPRHATVARIRGAHIDAASGDTRAPRAHLDEVVATFFAAPHSYTGEDVVEISAHGSPVVLRGIVRCAMAAGARLARRGEFTLRAFINGRLDLVQAEAVADLIASATPLQAAVAFDQLEGTLTRRIASIDADLFELIAKLEASLDFPDEGYHFIDPAEIASRVGAVIGQLDDLLRDAARGRMIREGATVVIAGRPNVGKSSLFNALVGSDRAIVTEVAGTTRDLVTERVEIEGLEVTLVDTAGARDVVDRVEREGVERGTRARSVADLVVLVIDRSHAIGPEDERLLHETAGTRRIVVANKSDLNEAQTVAEGLPVSAVTGAGLADLRRAIARMLAGTEPARERAAISNARHVRLLEDAREHLARAQRAAAQEGAPEEILLSDLHEARMRFDEIVGRRTSEDVLRHIFERFCIGK